MVFKFEKMSNSTNQAESGKPHPTKKSDKVEEISKTAEKYLEEIGGFSEEAIRMVEQTRALEYQAKGVFRFLMNPDGSGINPCWKYVDVSIPPSKVLIEATIDLFDPTSKTSEGEKPSLIKGTLKLELKDKNKEDIEKTFQKLGISVDNVSVLEGAAFASIEKIKNMLQGYFATLPLESRQLYFNKITHARKTLEEQGKKTQEKNSL